ncbi:MAG: hypothetical protein ACXABK_06495 [Candidatus Heimdallarchaeaceae archaeon]|jgi:hypothetical protein
MAILWQNKIPISAIIFELVLMVLLITITFFLWKKYFERRKRPVLFLGLNFSSFTIAAVLDTVGRWIGFFSADSYLDVSYTDLYTLLSYLFLALANCFIIVFIDEVFFHKGTDFILPFGILNGLVIGLIIKPVQGWFVDPSFGLLRQEIEVIIYFAVVSLLTYGILAYFAIREGVLNEERLPKVGFHLIGTYGLCLVIMFLFFAADTFSATILPAFSQGYSPFFYAGFSLSFVGLGLCYLGYIMPTWFKNLIM